MVEKHKKAFSMILVFGKSGQIASELSKNVQVKCFGREECDASINGKAAEIIRYLKPEVIINAAAYAEASHKENIPIIQISTDYVYGVSNENSIVETHSCNPINEYGKSKLAGERYLQEISSRYIIMRTAWLFSEHSNNFVKKISHQTKNEKHPIKVVSDQIGCPSSARVVADVLMRMAEFLSKKPENAEIYNYCGYPPISWADFAKHIIKELSSDIEIEKISTNPHNSPKRQNCSVLNCEKIKKDFKIEQHFWQDELKSVLNKSNG
jgi:dTDP-4-dehydrorhamnose reductase